VNLGQLARVMWKVRVDFARSTASSSTALQHPHATHHSTVSARWRQCEGRGRGVMWKVRVDFARSTASSSTALQHPRATHHSTVSVRWRQCEGRGKGSDVGGKSEWTLLVPQLPPVLPATHTPLIHSTVSARWRQCEGRGRGVMWKVRVDFARSTASSSTHTHNTHSFHRIRQVALV